MCQLHATRSDNKRQYCSCFLCEWQWAIVIWHRTTFRLIVWRANVLLLAECIDKCVWMWLDCGRRCVRRLRPRGCEWTWDQITTTNYDTFDGENVMQPLTRAVQQLVCEWRMCVRFALRVHSVCVSHEQEALNLNQRTREKERVKGYRGKYIRLLSLRLETPTECQAESSPWNSDLVFYGRRTNSNRLINQIQFQLSAVALDEIRWFHMNSLARATNQPSPFSFVLCDIRRG